MSEKSHDAAVPLALGAGGGLLLWYLLRGRHAKVGHAATASASTAPAPPSAAPAGRASIATAPAPRGCALRIDGNGLSADGARVGIADAVARCKAAGRAEVGFAKDASAAAYAELMVALGRAGVQTCARRNAGASDYTEFTVRMYPRGVKGGATVRWFRSEWPISWTDARDRLVDAGVLDPALAGRTAEPGGWMLSVDPHDYRDDHAEALPGGVRNASLGQFTLAIYPRGDQGPKRLRWFEAATPVTLSTGARSARRRRHR
ncbi:MAG: hypothetical protein H6709_02295 [Kofleriaceae bacterium]|nr:hypothetical protein [Myxococcales bacterium]MCB9570902.1 hypothetical protein [Kofleriaceae bacterium]